MDDLRVVYHGQNRRDCADRALVLSARSIPHQTLEDDAGLVIVVPASRSAEAAEELRRYDEENEPTPAKPVQPVETHDPVPGVIAYLIAVVGIAWLASISAFGENWRFAGRVDGSLVRDGELWRLFTALTLHGSLSHIVGNIVFGSLFGVFAGRYAGSGVAWLAILVSAAIGNGLNTLLLEESHRSIGASTAVFAALGLASGFAWRARVFADGRWISRAGPIVAGLALLTYTGTGGPNTDIGAHLMGFVTGFGAGILLADRRSRLGSADLQRGAAALAIGTLAIAWVLALAA
ncbi:MAG: rhomboid family intramembrane serine protease [Pseudomonadota bacterium]